MSWLPRQVAPAGSPIGAKDLLDWLAASRRWSRVNGELREMLCARFGVRHSILTSTGRAGLTVILRALGAAAPRERNEVILPSYTCYSVAASIVKAGLTPRVVDIDSRTLDFDHAQLQQTDFRRVLAIVATSLYGLPANLPVLEQLARERGVYLIDDSAQAMSAAIGDRFCGTFGDVGLLSFDKGKGVSAIDGGVILTNSDSLAAAIASQLEPAEAPPTATNLAYVAKALAYAAFLRPSLYAIPNGMPGLGLGVTRYTTDFPITGYTPLLAALAVTMLPRVEQFVGARRSNANSLLHELRDVGQLQSFAVLPQSRPSYVRLPLLAAEPATRDRLVVDLRRAGIGATGSYPASIVDVPELRSILPPNVEAAAGRKVSSRILTLPTHPFVSPADLRCMVDVVRRSLPVEAVKVSPQLVTN